MHKVKKQIKAFPIDIYILLPHLHVYYHSDDFLIGAQGGSYIRKIAHPSIDSI